MNSHVRSVSAAWLGLFLATLAIAQNPSTQKPAQAPSRPEQFAQASEHGSPLDKARLEQVMAAWATLDASRAAPFYATDDPGLVIYDIAPLKYSGWAEVEKGAVEVFKPVKSMTLKLNDDAQVHNTGNLAWATATLIIDSLNKDGSRKKIDARWTTIWEKRGPNWLIVHEHLSIPPPPA